MADFQDFSKFQMKDNLKVRQSMLDKASKPPEEHKPVKKGHIGLKREMSKNYFFNDPLNNLACQNQ